MKTESDKVPNGEYEFAVYQWRYLGIKDDFELKLVCSLDAVTPHLAGLLENAVDADGHENYPDFPSENLDTKHYQLWSKAQAVHRQQNRKLAEYRKESLSTSHQDRLGLLHEQLKQAGNENIRRMRQSQIESAKTDYARRAQELEDVGQKADITIELVAYGILNVGG